MKCVENPLINVVVLHKGGEHYMLMFTADRKRDALQRVGLWADNYGLSFTWHDAARMSHEIRELA